MPRALSASEDVEQVSAPPARGRVPRRARIRVVRRRGRPVWSVVGRLVRLHVAGVGGGRFLGVYPLPVSRDMCLMVSEPVVNRNGVLMDLADALATGGQSVEERANQHSSGCLMDAFSSGTGGPYAP